MSLEVFNVAKVIFSNLFVCALTCLPADNLMKFFFEGLVGFLVCGVLVWGVFFVCLSPLPPPAGSSLADLFLQLKIFGTFFCEMKQSLVGKNNKVVELQVGYHTLMKHCLVSLMRTFAFGFGNCLLSRRESPQIVSFYVSNGALKPLRVLNNVFLPMHPQYPFLVT